MKRLALTLPGGEIINPPAGLKPEFSNLGGFLTQLFSVAVSITVFLAFIWVVWGGFQLILSSGNKEELGKARERIRWALVGLIVTLLAYSITRYVSGIFDLKTSLPW
ncbi:hypothetical protein HYW42_01095 [Candidatus Daviesbacteria bacterium]|nr:hypothetical protein [Candidatus Daviesbacteria bacterium]